LSNFPPPLMLPEYASIAGVPSLLRKRESVALLTTLSLRLNARAASVPWLMVVMPNNCLHRRGHGPGSGLGDPSGR
jgi:hypothetical protein